MDAAERGKLLHKLADLMERDAVYLAASHFFGDSVERILQFLESGNFGQWQTL
jgi:hypothetical protein